MSELYEHQVGGHGTITKGEAGRIVKACNVKEKRFYEVVMSSRTWLNGYVAQCYGVREREGGAGVTEKTAWEIELEDINYKYQKPCIMDVKVGTRHYDDDANEDKVRRTREMARKTTTGSTGLRIVGSQVYKEGRAGYVRRGKAHGKSLAAGELGGEFAAFFSPGEGVRREVVEAVLRRVEGLEREMRGFGGYNFYSSSLLICYDAEKRGGGGEGVAAADVRMIDFAHTVPATGERDDGYAFGLSSLARLLGDVVAEAAR